MHSHCLGDVPLASSREICSYVTLRNAIFNLLHRSSRCITAILPFHFMSIWCVGISMLSNTSILYWLCSRESDNFGLCHFLSSESFPCTKTYVMCCNKGQNSDPLIKHIILLLLMSVFYFYVASFGEYWHSSSFSLIG